MTVRLQSRDIQVLDGDTHLCTQHFYTEEIKQLQINRKKRVHEGNTLQSQCLLCQPVDGDTCSSLVLRVKKKQKTNPQNNYVLIDYKSFKLFPTKILF